MQSKHRSRYEASLAQIARGARAAAAALDEAGEPDASWEFQLIAVWVSSELELSMKNKTPRGVGDRLLAAAIGRPA